MFDDIILDLNDEQILLVKYTKHSLKLQTGSISSCRRNQPMQRTHLPYLFFVSAEIRNECAQRKKGN